MRAFSLVGVDGNAYSVMGYTRRAMRLGNFTKDEIDKVMEDARSDGYNHLLCVCMDAIDKVNERLGLDEEDY